MSFQDLIADDSLLFDDHETISVTYRRNNADVATDNNIGGVTQVPVARNLKSFAGMNIEGIETMYSVPTKNLSRQLEPGDYLTISSVKYFILLVDNRTFKAYNICAVRRNQP